MSVRVEDLAIVHYPANVLRKKTAAIELVTDHVQQVAERMLELMHEAPGVGLAAPQVGLSWRMFVANWTGEPGEDHVFINPEIVEPSTEVALREEGCLSLPQIYGEVSRSVSVTIRALDIEGVAFEMTAEGLPARVWQHEFDHLEGVLIIDRMSRLDKTANKQLLRAMEKQATK